MNIDYADVMRMALPEQGADEEHYLEMAEAYEATARRMRAIGILADCFETRKTRAAKRACGRRARLLWRLAGQMRKAWRDAQIFNFVLRVKMWVLASAVRRMALKTKIGERVMARWYQRLAHNLTHTLSDREPDQGADEIVAVIGRKRDKQAEGLSMAVSKWYGLYPIPNIRDQSFVPHTTVSVPVTELGDARQKPACKRAFPIVRFYPFELEAGACNPAVTASFCWLFERPQGVEGHATSVVRPVKDPVLEEAKHQRRQKVAAASLREREAELAAQPVHRSWFSSYDTGADPPY